MLSVFLQALLRLRRADLAGSAPAVRAFSLAFGGTREAAALYRLARTLGDGDDAA